ncbi:MAG TPA: hypothetical protein VEI51_05455 [Methanomicrobiales archaeon]|nr:hypothetical protein [Methanomicrobiales archaeon]
MPGGWIKETWWIVPWTVVAALGGLLVLAGISLVLWSDLLVDLFIGALGVLAIVLGVAVLTGGHLLGRARPPSIFLIAGGIVSILFGVAVIFRHDLVLDLIIYAGAFVAILIGLALLAVGLLLSLGGWIRWAILLGGLGFLASGAALALFPDLVSRVLVTAGGAMIALCGCLAIWLALGMRRDGRPAG